MILFVETWRVFSDRFQINETKNTCDTHKRNEKIVNNQKPQQKIEQWKFRHDIKSKQKRAGSLVNVAALSSIGYSMRQSCRKLEDVCSNRSFERILDMQTIFWACEFSKPPKGQQFILGKKWLTIIFANELKKLNSFSCAASNQQAACDMQIRHILYLLLWIRFICFLFLLLFWLASILYATTMRQNERET